MSQRGRRAIVSAFSYRQGLIGIVFLSVTCLLLPDEARMPDGRFLTELFLACAARDAVAAGVWARCFAMVGSVSIN